MRLLLCWQERVLWSPGLSELQEYKTTLGPGGEVLPYRVLWPCIRPRTQPRHSRLQFIQLKPRIKPIGEHPQCVHRALPIQSLGI